MLLDKVFDHLELVEKDYFGLQYADIVPAPDAMVSKFLLILLLFLVPKSKYITCCTRCMLLLCCMVQSYYSAILLLIIHLDTCIL